MVVVKVRPQGDLAAKEAKADDDGQGNLHDAAGVENGGKAYKDEKGDNNKLHHCRQKAS